MTTAQLQILKTDIIVTHASTVYAGKTQKQQDLTNYMQLVVGDILTQVIISKDLLMMLDCISVF